MTTLKQVSVTTSDYKVCDAGYVIGPSGKRLKPRLSKGYLIVRIYPFGECYLHRLVAEAFIPNPLGLPQVNHKDEDKENCAAYNLEWCDASYNQAYSQGKAVAQYLNGELVNTYKSHGDAARETGLLRESISSATRTGYKHAGYNWINIKEDQCNG